MRDLSLHLLDLAQNSIKAGASLVTIRMTVDEAGWLTFTCTSVRAAPAEMEFWAISMILSASSRIMAAAPAD